MFVEITAEQFYPSAKAVPSTNDGIRVKYRQVNLALSTCTIASGMLHNDIHQANGGNPTPSFEPSGLPDKQVQLDAKFCYRFGISQCKLREWVELPCFPKQLFAFDFVYDYNERVGNKHWRSASLDSNLSHMSEYIARVKDA